MTQWEKEIIRYYGSLRAYVMDQLGREKPNPIKTRFDEFYREMEALTQEGMEKYEACFVVCERFGIQDETVDDYVLDAVLYSL